MAEPDVMMYEICVVTKIPDPTKESGNLAAPLLYPGESAREAMTDAQIQNFLLLGILHFRTEVFTLGEILILDHNDRDHGTTRKPDKWDITTQSCRSLEEAIILSEQIKREEDNAVRAGDTRQDVPTDNG